MAELKAIIAPSVLASDFGQLTCECQRMVKDGADWVRVSAYRDLLTAQLHMDVMDGSVTGLERPDAADTSSPTSPSARKCWGPWRRRSRAHGWTAT